MTNLYWVLASVLAVFGVYISVMNWRVFLNNHVFRKTWTSAVPLIGGLTTAAAVCVMPVAGSWKYAWIPLVADWGSLPAILVSLFLWWRRGT
jgi:hypothetical protein